MKRLTCLLHINCMWSSFNTPLRATGPFVAMSVICAVELFAIPLKQWDKRFGGSLDDSAYAIQQTSDGGYIVAGGSDSGADGDKSEPSRGGVTGG